jgi:hypothetical protein
LRFLSVPKFARCSPTLGFARQETVNLPKGPLELGEMPELNV